MIKLLRNKSPDTIFNSSAILYGEWTSISLINAPYTENPYKFVPNMKRDILPHSKFIYDNGYLKKNYVLTTKNYLSSLESCCTL